MSDEPIARAYASALFAAATDSGSIERVQRELGQLATALAESEPLRVVLFNPRIEADAKRRVLAGLSEGADRMLANTLQLLAQKERVSLLPQIRREYDELAAQQAQLLEVEVVSAVPLDAELERQVVARVEGATGKTVRLSKRVDGAILGGLVLRLGDVIVDGSLRSRLGQLKHRMVTAEVRGGEQ